MSRRNSGLGRRIQSHKGEGGFTLVELLVVIAIISILAGLIIPAVIIAMRTSRQGGQELEVASIIQAITSYEQVHAVYPPGDGNGTRDLVRALSTPGPKKMEFFYFKPDMLTANGDVINIVHGDDADPPANVIHYRNNRGRTAAEVKPHQPPMSKTRPYDIWFAGGDYDSKRPQTAWSVHRP